MTIPSTKILGVRVDLVSLNQTLSIIDNFISSRKTHQIVVVNVAKIIKAIKDVLQDTPPELSADIIDQGIIMTGGTSQLRNLPELVYRRTGVRAKLADDALYCVAKGTGIALEHLDTYKKSIIAKR